MSLSVDVGAVFGAIAAEVAIGGVGTVGVGHALGAHVAGRLAAEPARGGPGARGVPEPAHVAAAGGAAEPARAAETAGGVAKPAPGAAAPPHTAAPVAGRDRSG